MLLHGWPFDSRSWEPQVHALLAAGFRVVTYDRRGFGRSSRPATGYDFDTLAADLDALLLTLDLSDVTSSGSPSAPASSPATSARTAPGGSRAVFFESLAPSFVKGRQPHRRRPGRGGGRAAGDPRRPRRLADRHGPNFLNLDEYLGTRVSADTERHVADRHGGVPEATWACPQGWLEDFSADITDRRPALIIHGTADRILPIDGQGRRPRGAPRRAVRRDRGRPAPQPCTHAAEANAALLRPSPTRRDRRRDVRWLRVPAVDASGARSSPASAAPDRRSCCCTATPRPT